MAVIELVFEGGGAKGMVFAGALDVLFQNDAYTYGRLLGTSAGAITAVLLAAGYTPAEMLASLGEKDAAGKSVFESFLGLPAPFDAEAIRNSAIRKLLTDLDMPFVPGFIEDHVDDWVVAQLTTNPAGRHLFSFIERGGWYSADAFVTWLQSRLNAGQYHGEPRQFGGLTLEQFFAATGVEMTLVASDTTAARMLLLNHRTAPDCPVVWAARMSMSVPLLWQEVVWQPAWGPYLAWDAGAERLVESEIAGHVVVDGGLLSNFPISLFLADRPDIAAVVGPSVSNEVLGLLIDETLPVPNRPSRPENTTALSLTNLPTIQRLMHLVNTATTAHDNMAVAVFARHVVHLPAAGYSTTEFDMTDAERDALVEAGREAMRAFLAQAVPAEATRFITAPFAASAEAVSLANRAAPAILEQ